MRHQFKFSTCAHLLCAMVPVLAVAQSAPQSTKKQFEVASVKPVKVDAGPGMAMARLHLFEMMAAGSIPMPDPGRVRIQNWSLRQLIAAAYRVRSDKVSGPSWMEDEHFDIEAKLPEGAKREDANEMLQALLAERFGLELHRESRELAGFALVVGKGGAKLEPSGPPPPPPDPSLSPEELKEKQKQDAQDRIKAMQAQIQERMRTGTQRAGSSSSSWNSVTTAQLADHLASTAGGPVVDETGLTGTYKVKIETWRATDDDPGQTVFEAIEKLGLKLTSRKVPTDFVVIDKVSKMPSAN